MILLALCIVLAIGFTVGFNIISRLSLSTTRHEYAYTILWQVFCGLLSLLFLPFDRFSITLNSRVLLLFALSVALWALVDAFLFSAFKYKAFQLGNVPQVVALSASSTLLTALAGIVVLKEDKHVALKIVAAGLATLGVVLVQL